MTRGRMIFVACVAVVGIGARFMTTGSPSDEAVDPEAMRGDSAGSQRSGPGPRATQSGVPRGWSHDESGARAAAISAVSLTGDVARAGFITRDDMIGALTTQRFGPVLASQSAVQLEELAAELSVAGATTQSLLLHEVPLTAHVDQFDAHAARVEVWSVLIAALPDVAAPRQAWRTVDLDLRWENGDWLVDGWTVRPGPTPMLDGQTSIASSDEIAQVTSWSMAAEDG